MGELKIECHKGDIECPDGSGLWYADLTDGNHRIQLATDETASGARRKARDILTVLMRSI